MEADMMNYTFDWVYRFYLKQAEATVNRKCKKEDREDVLQLFWMRVARYLPEFDESKGLLRTWLTNLLLQQVIDTWRRSKPAASVVLAIDDEDVGVSEDYQFERQEDVLARLEEIISTMREVETLSPMLKEAILLRHVHGCEYDEMSEKLAVPLGTVKSRVHNALVKVHKKPPTAVAVREYNWKRRHGLIELQADAD
jgi:RNA polymerase sigma-70 factor, ECF subfamily